MKPLCTRSKPSRRLYGGTVAETLGETAKPFMSACFSSSVLSLALENCFRLFACSINTTYHHHHHLRREIKVVTCHTLFSSVTSVDEWCTDLVSHTLPILFCTVFVPMVLWICIHHAFFFCVTRFSQQFYIMCFLFCGGAQLLALVAKNKKCLFAGPH